MAEFQAGVTHPRSLLRTALAFASAILIATPALAGVSGPERCLAGPDFNGDGFPDIFVPYLSFTNPSVLIIY